MSIRRFTPRATTVLALLLASACSSTPSPARQPSGAGPISGKWLAYFPAWNYEIVLELATESAGTAHAGFLGESGDLRLENLRFGGSGFQMDAITGGRKLAVSGTVSGDSMFGRWHVDHLIYRFFGKGTFTGVRLAPDHLAPLAANMPAFDSLRSTIQHQFYDPKPGHDWEMWGDEERISVAKAHSDAEALSAVRGMLATLSSSHLHLDAVPAGLSLRPASGPPADTPVVWWSTLPSGDGYVRIAHFRDESPRARTALDSAFVALGSTPGMIVDLRGNPGGSVPLADRLADHLLEQRTPVGYFVTRDGLVRHGLSSIDAIVPSALPHLSVGDSVRADNFFDVLGRLGGAAMLVAGGGVDQPYRGRVVLLVDGGTMSTAEAVAAALQEIGRATLVGRLTGGAMLAATQVEIATGWILTLPLADFRTPRGAQVEGVGVRPDHEVTTTDSGDATLEQAVAILK